MSFEQLLAWIPPGSPDEALARQIDFERLPSHVAMIMDGNGRWAAQRHLPRVEGHRAGIDSVRDVVETSARLGIDVLTLYAFSMENWKRPRAEVNTLMMLLKRYIRLEIGALNKNNIRFRVIGRIDDLAPDVQTDPDLLIRTSGEMRVSNFLLWQIAYAEIWVTDTLWPDFRRRDLLQAIVAYQKRDRRYGGIKPPAVALGVK
jgi:undecaprenyl pyrophosphate synthase